MGWKPGRAGQGPAGRPWTPRPRLGSIHVGSKPTWKAVVGRLWEVGRLDQDGSLRR